MSEQLKLFPRPKMTVAQVVYGEWLRQGRAMSPEHYHPVRAMKLTAEYFDLPLRLVERIVHVQSRWNARRTLWNTKHWKEAMQLVNENHRLQESQ